MQNKDGRISRPQSDEHGDEPSPPHVEKCGGGPPRSQPTNVVLWGGFGAVSMAVGAYFIFGVHGKLTLDAVLGLLGQAARTGLFICAGILLESVLRRTGDGFLAGTGRRRSWLHAYWVGVMLLTVCLVVDVFVFMFAGYHLTTALRILLADGPGGVGKVLDATGLPLKVVVAAVAGFAAAVALAAWLSKKSRDMSRRWSLDVARGRALKWCFVAAGVVACIDVIGFHSRNAYLWDREVRRVPLAFAVARPEPALATFRVGLRPGVWARTNGPVKRLATASQPDIYLIVIESLRKDVMAVMPRLSRFAERAWTFEHAVTAGNVTHYSWYGLLCGDYPIYFDAAKEQAQAQGSRALRILREMGYRVELLATPDTAYQNLEAIVFGPRGMLLDAKFHPKERTAAERDERVIAELTREVLQGTNGGRFRLVALDSTHYDYMWGKDFTPPYAPYAAGASILKNYAKNTRERAMVVNRYKNAAAWVDSLLGKFFDALATSGRMEQSIVIVTGDHGEAFWEHGAGTHGSDLGREQVEVAFAMRMPGRQPGRFPGVFSLMDVMPTVLGSLGYEGGGLAGKAHPEGWTPNRDARAEHPKGWTPNGVAQAEHPEAGTTNRAYALTFQGWNERGFRFGLTGERASVLLELDRAKPSEARRLAVKEVTGVESGVGEWFLREWPKMREELPFLEFN